MVEVGFMKERDVKGRNHERRGDDAQEKHYTRRDDL